VFSTLDGPSPKLPRRVATGRRRGTSTKGRWPLSTAGPMGCPARAGPCPGRARHAAGHQGARAHQLLGPPAGQGGAGRAGAIGYVLKDSEPADLLAAAHAAAGGHVPTDPRVAAALLPATGGGGGPGAADGLSPRETEVLPPGRAGPGEQADRAGAGHHRAHRQGPPRAGVPQDRRARPDERGPVGPRQPSRRLVRRFSASDTHGARRPRSACHLLSTQPPDAVAPRVAGLP